MPEKNYNDSKILHCEKSLFKQKPYQIFTLSLYDHGDHNEPGKTVIIPIL